MFFYFRSVEIAFKQSFDKEEYSAETADLFADFLVTANTFLLCNIWRSDISK